VKPAILALLLVGCVSVPDDYWVRDKAPAEVKHIVRVDFPCGKKDTRGCWHAHSGTIEIKKGLSAADEACVLRHERAHSQGWSHPNRQSFLWDCGPDPQLVEINK
jgi:hypothetical protein